MSITMAPTQTNTTRIEVLEENVLALQAAIPEMQEALENRITEMMQQMEVNQFKLSVEYSQKVESCMQGQEDINSTMKLLMAEVKNIGVKMVIRVMGI